MAPVGSGALPGAAPAGRTTITWPHDLHFILKARPDSSSETV
jgi:hypothetical protein